MCFGGNNSPDPAPTPEPQQPLSWADAHSTVTGQSNPDGTVTPTAAGLAKATGSKRPGNKADEAKREKKTRDKYRSKGLRPDGSHYADFRDPASRTNWHGGGKRSKAGLEKRAREQYLDDLRANPDGW